MMKKGECYKAYVQYKRICPEKRDYADLPFLLKDQSIVELQLTYTRLKKEFASLVLCEQKRTFVFENCYEDRDEGHKQAIDVVKEQQRQCLAVMTKVVEEIQARSAVAQEEADNKSPLSPNAKSTVVMSASQAKRAKKKARKQSNDTMKRQLEDDAGFRSAWSELERELERIEKNHLDVRDGVLKRLQQHISEKPSDRRYQYLYQIVVEEGEDVAYYVWKSKHRESVHGYVNSNIRFNTDVSTLTAEDIDHYIDSTIDDLIAGKTYDESLVKKLMVNVEVNKLPAQLTINLARFVFYGFLQADMEDFVTDGQISLQTLLIELIVLPTVQSLRFQISKLRNDVHLRKYAKCFGDDWPRVKDGLERFYTMVRLYFDPTSKSDSISWFYFNAIIPDEGSDRAYKIETVQRFVTVILGTSKKYFEETKKYVLSMPPAHI